MKAFSHTTRRHHSVPTALEPPPGRVSPLPSTQHTGFPLTKASLSHWSWCRVRVLLTVPGAGRWARVPYRASVTESTFSQDSGFAAVCTMGNLSDRKEEASAPAQLSTAGAHVGEGHRSSSSSCEGSLARISTHVSCIHNESPTPVPIPSLCQGGHSREKIKQGN